MLESAVLIENCPISSADVLESVVLEEESKCPRRVR
jgi:hypothetical protein